MRQLVLFPSRLRRLPKLFFPFHVPYSIVIPSSSLTLLLLLPTYSSFRLSLSLHVNYHLPPFSLPLALLALSNTFSVCIPRYFSHPPSSSAPYPPFLFLFNSPCSSFVSPFLSIHFIDCIQFCQSLLHPSRRSSSPRSVLSVSAFLPYFISYFIFLQDFTRSSLPPPRSLPPSRRPSLHPTRSSSEHAPSSLLLLLYPSRR